MSTTAETTDIKFPLKEIDKNGDKTAEHWFDFYSVAVQKMGYDQIPLINKDSVNKGELVRFRGIISNQLNNEYFGKSCQFRDYDDVKQSLTANDDSSIMERYPMTIRHEPNQTKWSKSVIYNDNNIPTEQVNDVLAQFYCHSKSLKICDFVEIYGIWSPPKNDTNKDDADNQETKENKENTQNDADLSISSQTNKYDNLPKIHVLYWRKIEWINPLISVSKDNVNDIDKLFNRYYEDAAVIRSSLIQYISKNYLNDDHLLAEYILLHLISETVSKTNDVLIGNFALNIRGEFNAYKIKEIYNLFSPYLLNIDLSLKNLDETRFVPVKNNETDELEIGILQFANKTSIIIDETMLQIGKLKENGLLNIEALKELITRQKVFYDFQFHAIPFDVNSSVCVLSKGAPLKQLQTHCFLYYEGNEAKSNDNNNGDDDEEQFSLNDYRMYLSAASYLLQKFSLNAKDVCQGIENDFVDIRQKDEEANENTLHHRLLLMRLINSSFLNQTTDNDMMKILKYMQMLETKRMIRNEKFTKKQCAKSNGTPLDSVKEE